ncbi:hypothetical protein JQC72_14955 [Polycladomyces sp. WAk]|uniref:Lysine biosynthesis protein LysW n=1 Tax=Polycladomyces zharkentensis TaxID=2807616 RepID=A0ABS2WMQ8_9BACL|nr:hypothetical protein [Polycladomyces sp. WAk]MBN2910797.1 hypothetical protein [Polycladomyces sp. WAk]
MLVQPIKKCPVCTIGDVFWTDKHDMCVECERVILNGEEPELIDEE